MNYPKVFVIILNWNGKQDTLECLESVFKLDYPNFDVIVVDNGSTDDSITTIKAAFPQVILIENRENLGFTGGNNIAMHYAMGNGGDYIWLLNNDSVVESNTLTRIVEVAENDPVIGLVSPVIRFYYEPERIQFSGGYINISEQETGFYTKVPSNCPEYGYCTFLWGTALLIKRQVVENIGYLDDRFFAYWEDVDISLRALLAGYQCAIAYDCYIFHKDAGSSNGRKSPWYIYLSTRNRFLLWTKNLDGFAKYRYIVTKYLPGVLRRIAWLRKQQDTSEGAEACLAGCWNALRGIYGSWNRCIEVAKYFKNISSWHPILLANLLEGKHKEIWLACVQRIRKIGKGKTCRDS